MKITFFVFSMELFLNFPNFDEDTHDKRKFRRGSEVTFEFKNS